MQRDIIRMVSGEVLIVDQLRPVETMKDLRPGEEDLIVRIDPFLENVPGGWFAAIAYGDLGDDAVGVPVAIVAANISSIRPHV